MLARETLRVVRLWVTGSYSSRDLNLFSPSAFHWVQMLVVVEREQLPVPQARDGDPAAWDVLFQRYQLPLYAYIFELVRSEQTTLDLVQETFIAAVRHLAGLRDDDRFGSWLFGIAHQKCIQHWRRQQRLARVLDPEAEVAEDAPNGAEAGPVEWLIRREDEEHLQAALARLPEPQRAVLLLHFVEDFSLEDIATITVTPVGTVKSRLHYARKALRDLLEERK